MYRTVAIAAGLAAAVGISIAPLTIGGCSVANAAEIKVMSAVPFQPIMEDLGPTFERISGHKLTMTFATMGEVVKRVRNGEAVDVVIVPQQGTDTLVKDGKATPGALTIVAHSGIAVAVRKGAFKPDISSPESLKRALLAAKSITYSDPASGGESGFHFAKVLERLGIANEMKTKTILAKPGNDAGVLVANGMAEIAVHQFQVLNSVAGIDVVGALPGDLQDTIVFSAAIMDRAKNVDPAKVLIDFLRTPEGRAVIKAKGMEPDGATSP